MKKNSKDVYPSLLEVWDWKDEVFKDIKNKSYKERTKYFQLGLVEASKLLGKNLIKKADGSYNFL